MGLLLEEHPAALPFVFTMRLSAGHGHKSLTMGICARKMQIDRKIGLTKPGQDVSARAEIK